jgi:hypothetical protein
MNGVRNRQCQRGVSAWTLSGSLLVAAGLVGIGVALIEPGSRAPPVAASPAKGGTTASAAAGIKPAKPSAAPTSVDKAAVPGSGPHVSWHGSWQGAAADTLLAISATRVGACKWVDSPDPTFEGQCQAGYAPASVSLAEIARKFDESVAQFQQTPHPISAAEAAQSRGFIGRIKPGNYRVVLMFDGTDCSMKQMIVDGDSLLRITHCGYRQQVSLLTRVR